MVSFHSHSLAIQIQRLQGEVSKLQSAMTTVNTHKPDEESIGRQLQDVSLSGKITELVGKLDAMSQSMKTVEAEKDLFAARLDFMSGSAPFDSRKCVTLTQLRSATTSWPVNMRASNAQRKKRLW